MRQAFSASLQNERPYSGCDANPSQPSSRCPSAPSLRHHRAIPMKQFATLVQTRGKRHGSATQKKKVALGTSSPISCLPLRIWVIETTTGSLQTRRTHSHLPITRRVPFLHFSNVSPSCCRKAITLFWPTVANEPGNAADTTSTASDASRWRYHGRRAGGTNLAP